MLDRGLSRAETNLFRALGDETRLQLLELLFEGERNVGDLVGKVGKEQSAISHHLRCLRTCGLVKTRKAGKEIFYSLNGQGRVKDLLLLARAHVETTLNEILTCDVVAEPNVVLKPKS